METYSEDKIKTLSSLEHIRARPGMYIGRQGDGSNPEDGIYVLLKEVIDNSVDEFIMGHGKRIEVAINDAGEVTVRDYGRGIPLGKLVACVSEMNTGAKYNTEVFQYSVGLNGVGLKAVNALSTRFEARSVREGRFKSALFIDGKLAEEHEGDCDEEDGTRIWFVPSQELFPNYHFEEKFVRRRMLHYTYLNTGLMVCYNGEKFVSRNGLLDLLEEKIGSKEEQLYAPIYFRGPKLEFAFCHTTNFGESYYSFVNAQYTNDGGAHLSAYREGILKAINEFYGKTFDGDDVRSGIVGTVAVRVQTPMFEGQTKGKLGSLENRSEVVQQVKEFVEKALYKDKEFADALKEKIENNAAVRREIQAVKKGNKEKNKRSGMLKIAKFRDCKFHLGDKSDQGERTMIFLTEGDSASGSIVSSRDPNIQAIFSLRGKPANMYGKGMKFLYTNEELCNIMRALGVEDGIDGLRFEKIVFATDADVDGLHIRNLLITFFLTFFKELIYNQHVYILETPLFRVRNKTETIYCYNTYESEKAQQKLGKGCEITRFKGLGEISPKEFKQFIGDTIRLVPVTVDSINKIDRFLEFYMGGNTPLRQAYVMENLR